MTLPFIYLDPSAEIRLYCQLFMITITPSYKHVINCIMSLWVVFKFFNAPNSHDHMVSIHDTEDSALEWARSYCKRKHGEIMDVTYGGMLNGHTTYSKAYGPTDTYMSWIYHVKSVSYRGKISPPYETGDVRRDPEETEIELEYVEHVQIFTTDTSLEEELQEQGDTSE